MSKKASDDLQDQMLLADALLRLKSLENVLIAKGIVTKEELSSEMDVLAKQIAKSLLARASVPGDLDELINSLNLANKPNGN